MNGKAQGFVKSIQGDDQCAKAIYELADGIISADDMGYAAIQHFMNSKVLTSPECALFYAKIPKHYTLETFRAILPLEKHKGIRAIIAIASLNSDDTDRVALSYERYTHYLVLSFPAHEKLDATAKKFINRLEKQVPDIKSFRKVI